MIGVLNNAFLHTATSYLRTCARDRRCLVGEITYLLSRVRRPHVRISRSMLRRAGCSSGVDSLRHLFCSLQMLPRRHQLPDRFLAVHHIHPMKGMNAWCSHLLPDACTHGHDFLNRPSMHRQGTRPNFPGLCQRAPFPRRLALSIFCPSAMAPRAIDTVPHARSRTLLAQCVPS